MDVGSNISKARKIRGISQEDLANSLDVTRQCVSLWENNQTTPTLENMLAISEVLNFKVSVLMGQTAFPVEKTEKDFEKERLNREENLNKARHHEAKQMTILASIFSFSSVFLFLVPGLGVILPATSIAISVLARKKEKNNWNLLSFILGCVYLFAGIVAIVGSDFIRVFF